MRPDGRKPIIALSGLGEQDDSGGGEFVRHDTAVIQLLSCDKTASSAWAQLIEPRHSMVVIEFCL
jgi:hypothetical protein